MSKPTTWVDLTHLLNWEGRFTGIERLEYQLAIRFADKPDVKFFAYNQIAHAFNEVPAETLKIFASGYGGATVGAEFSKKLNLGKIIGFAKKFIPRRFRTFVKNKAMKTSNKLVLPNPFSAGDVIFVAATFSDQAFLDNLIELKKSVQIKLTYLVHDIIPIVRPNYVKQWDTDHFVAYYSKLLPVADTILSVSESTKSDLLDFCKTQQIKVPKIEVVREGSDFREVKNPKRPIEMGGIKDFIICVGTFEVRKNYTLLYYAYKQAIREGVKMPPIILVGRKGWLVDDIAHIIQKDPQVKSLILHFDGIDDQGLAWMFKNALFTVQPAFYEGWGLPVDEALHYGKLCLSSDESSLPEVGGELVDYFSPFDSRQCMQKIAHYYNNPADLKRREQLIAKKYKPTTWSDTFEQVARFI